MRLFSRAARKRAMVSRVCWIKMGLGWMVAIVFMHSYTRALPAANNCLYSSRLA